MDHKLVKFITVVEARNFTAAAKRLHISQPALSTAIQELEKTLGTPLILRQGRQFTLTRAGQTVYATARRMQRDYSALQQQISSTAATQPHIRIGMLDTVAALLLTTDLDWQHIEIVVDNSTRLLENLERERIDAAIIVEQVIAPQRGVHLQPIGTEQFVFVGTPECVTSTKADDITNWLAFNADSTTYLQFTRQFEEHNITVQPIFHSTSMELLHTMCLQGRGIALLPKQLVASDIIAKKLLQLGSQQWPRKLLMSYTGQANQATHIATTLAKLLA